MVQNIISLTECITGIAQILSFVVSINNNIYLLIAIGLLTGGSDYFTCIKIPNWLLLNLSPEGYMRSM